MTDTTEADFDVPALVGYVLRTIAHNPQDYEDLRQEGIAAGLAGLKTWDSNKGTLSTHLVVRIRGAIHNYRQANASIVRTPRTKGVSPPLPDMELDAPVSDDPTEEQETGQEQLVYPTPPRDYAEPEVATGVARAAFDAARLLIRLPEPGQGVLRALYGVAMPRRSIREIAALTGLTASTVHRIAVDALKKLGQLQKTRDTAPAHRMNAESGLGAGRREFFSTDRLPGFWNEGGEE